MSRRHIAVLIILALVLGTVAVGLAGAWDGLWLAWAYEETGSSRLCYGGIEIVDVSRPVGVMGSEEDVAQGILTVRRKRHAWIPGEAFIVPDQMCPECDIEQHENCCPRYASGYCELRDGTRVDLPGTFRCTCTDPSHDGN